MQVSVKAPKPMKALRKSANDRRERTMTRLTATGYQPLPALPEALLNSWDRLRSVRTFGNHGIRP